MNFPTSPITWFKDLLGSGWGFLLRPLILGVAILILIPVFLGLFFTRVEPGEIGVRQDNVFGSGISEQDFGPGYHLRILGIHRYYTLSEHFDFVHFSENERLRIRTRDNNIVSLDVSVPFHVEPGEGYRIVQAGLHVGDAYKERTRNTTVGVLRERLAQMSAPDFFDTDVRLRVTGAALASLNEALAEFHVEAERIYIRAVFYRPEYEDQQQRIQLLQQATLLDHAQEEVSNRQQVLDNYRQETAALQNSRNAWWDEHMALLDRVYAVGVSEEGQASLVEAELAGRRLMDDPATEVDETAGYGEQLSAELSMHYSGEDYGLGVEGINAATNRAVAELEGHANSLQARYDAEAERVIAEIEFERDRRINELLSSAGGRALVALEAASRVSFADELVFHARDIPFVFDLNRMASMLMGVSVEGR
jgi:regulator of protease activity HflC (stomatin/prohibitin superfamily)